LVLQIRDVLSIVEADLNRLIDAVSALATRHRNTSEIGRTWLQHALPITFGLKAAGWLDALLRHRDRMRELRPRILVLQFGGAAGTLAALGDKGLKVAAALSDVLGLDLPDMPWHTQRDRVAELGATLGLLIGSMGKIARDVSLLMQTELAEVAEPSGDGRGGSSTMPHKRNPVTSAVVLAAAIEAPGLVSTLFSAMPQDHERGLGGWHAEWATVPRLMTLAAGALSHAAAMIEGLQVDPERMRRNLDLTRGLVMAEAVTMALGAKFGRLEAHRMVEAACRRAMTEDRHLKEMLAEDKEISAALGPSDLVRLFEPTNYIGVAGELIDRVLAARHR
jgi:3-carboxy-cis,cis-muconate cycloisomerase